MMTQHALHFNLRTATGCSPAGGLVSNTTVAAYNNYSVVKHLL